MATQRIVGINGRYVDAVPLFKTPSRSRMIRASIVDFSDLGEFGGARAMRKPTLILSARHMMIDKLPGLTGRFGTILADPPWRFDHRTGKVAPEHPRFNHYKTMSLDEICSMPVAAHAASRSHLYLWIPNALLREGLCVLSAWGFTYKTNIIWYKTRRDGGPDGRGVGFYFRNVTEIVLFGVRGRLRTLGPARRQVNIIPACKREHSRKPDELYDIIEACSRGPFLELFARTKRSKWKQWGDQLGMNPPTYKFNCETISQSRRAA